MRYTQGKERSAELLRVTLGLMGRHEASFNPITFTLWYEYAAGMNPTLHAALERMLAEQIVVGDAAVAELYAEHIAPGEASALQRVGGELQKVMTGFASSASPTGGVAALRVGNDAMALIARADEALYRSKNAGRDRVSCG